MGVDAKILLPANVRIGNVAEVIGALAGCAKSRRPLGHHYGGSWSIEVAGVSVTPCLPQMALISGPGFSVSYHFEVDGGRSRLLMPRSTAFWIAVGRRLVDFFGGSIEYMDCGDGGPDYRMPARTDDENCPEDGGAWQDLQGRIMAVEPVTRAEMESMAHLSAYGMVTT